MPSGQLCKDFVKPVPEVGMVLMAVFFKSVKLKRRKNRWMVYSTSYNVLKFVL